LDLNAFDPSGGSKPRSAAPGTSIAVRNSTEEVPMNRIGSILFAAGVALAASGCVATVTAPYPAVPAARVEVIPPAPSVAVVWEPGHWQWNGASYEWVPGHYVERAAVTGTQWVTGHWENRAGGWVWVPGHWA
jgi:hypothetical protein